MRIILKKIVAQKLEIIKQYENGGLKFESLSNADDISKSAIANWVKEKLFEQEGSKKTCRKIKNILNIKS